MIQKEDGSAAKAENAQATIENVQGAAVSALKIPKRKKLFLNEKVFIVCMLGPAIIWFLIFWVYVNIDSILLAFKIPTGDWSLLSMKTVLYDIRTGGTNLAISFRNTIYYFIMNMLMMPFHMILAYFFFRKVRGYRFFQVMFYLPAIVSSVIITQMFKDFILPEGPLGLVLQKVFSVPEEEVPLFLQNSDYAIWTVLFYSFWTGWGGNMLLMGGAMARLPIEVLESGRLDGVNTFQEIFLIVFPMMWTTVSTLIILSLTGIFGSGGPILALTKGYYETSTLGYWIYEKIVFTGQSAYNEVAAMGLVFTCVGVPIILFIRWLIERIPTVEY